MDTFKTAEHIKEQWRRLWPVDDPRLPMKRRGVVCPLCGSGSGKHKSGVKETPWHGKHRLKCFHCGFYGDAINLLSRELGIDAHGRGFIAIRKRGNFWRGAVSACKRRKNAALALWHGGSILSAEKRKARA